EVMDAEVSGETTLAILSRGEIDVQIATAKKYPRSVAKFTRECTELVTMSQSVAAECIYALPRGGKKIEGPSSRFAEVVISCWQNSRAGTRVVSVDDKTITAQGVFHDLERNVAVTYESRRRITDSKGNRFNDDMITMTGNAACSIALRNAVLKGVPKAFWAQIYERARHAVIGDVKSLVQSRQQAIELFGKMGVTPEMVFHALGIQGI